MKSKIETAGRSDQIAILIGSDRDREKKNRDPARSISFFKIFVCFIAFFEFYYI